MKVCSRYFVVVALLALFANLHFASAQTLERGAIRGTVYDASKAAIPGAKLTHQRGYRPETRAYDQ